MPLADCPKRNGLSNVALLTWKCWRQPALAPASKIIPRYLTGRKPGEPPPTLFEYIPDNALSFHL